MSLLNLQRRMAADVRRPLTPDFDMQTVAEDGQAVAALVSAYIRPNATLTSFERFAIYNRQYWVRIIDAVSEDYPALSAILGPNRFEIPSTGCCHIRKAGLALEWPICNPWELFQPEGQRDNCDINLQLPERLCVPAAVHDAVNEVIGDDGM